MTTAHKGHSNYKEDKDKQSQDSLKKTINKNISTSGLGSEVHNGNGASNSYTDNDDDNDEILYGYKFQMTDDQKKAAGELQNLKLDLGFTAEDEPGPFYDVSERLRQLNAELAQEQIPEVEERNRKIQFKENLVDFAAPPPDQDMEDEPETSRRDELHNGHSDSDSGESVEHKSGVKKNGLTDKEKDVEKSSSKSDEQDRSSKASSEKRKIAHDEPGDAPSKKEVSHHELDGEERVVLERNGRFEVVAVKDLTPEEREIYVTGPSSVLPPANASKSAPDSAKSSTVKKPERKSSVASSVSPRDSGSSRASNSSKGTPVTSARGNDSQKVPTSARPNSRSSSPKKHQSSSMSNMEKYEQKRKEDEAKRQKQEESDRHFQAWLKKKKEEEKKEKENKKENKDDKEKDESKEDEAFKRWKAKKERQMQSEKKLKEEEAKYYESQWETHTETECEKNYKKWLKEKQKQAKEKEEEERQKMKTFRLMARKSRNSANAGGQGSSAYIDYYGYRY